MRNKSEQRRYIRLDVEGEDFRNLMLKQGGLFKVTNDKEMSSKKASAIFIALSLILLTGIWLLPKSSQVFVPAATATPSATFVTSTAP